MSSELTIKAIYDNYNILMEDDFNTPINFELEELDSSRIIIKKEVNEKLNNIALTTKTLDKEIGFIMYGHEYLDNQVVFDKITISDAKLKSFVTEFGPSVTEELKNIISENLDSRTVVCYGHSHPDISDDYMYFSLSDLDSLVELTINNESFLNKEIQLIGCLVTNDLKFVYYDPEQNNFYNMGVVEYE